MRTRNADSAKSTATKKTPPVRKVAAKVSPTSSESMTPKIVETKRGSAGKAKQAKANDTTPPQHTTSSDSKSDQSRGIILLSFLKFMVICFAKWFRELMKTKNWNKVMVNISNTSTESAFPCR